MVTKLNDVTLTINGHEVKLWMDTDQLVLSVDGIERRDSDPYTIDCILTLFHRCEVPKPSLPETKVVASLIQLLIGEVKDA